MSQSNVQEENQRRGWCFHESVAQIKHCGKKKRNVLTIIINNEIIISLLTFHKIFKGFPPEPYSVVYPIRSTLQLSRLYCCFKNTNIKSRYYTLTDSEKKKKKDVK